jgi:hypothetical protein
VITVKIRLPSQCKVRKWWSIDQDEWIIFFHFFRSHCQLEANPSQWTRISSSTSTRGTCLSNLLRRNLSNLSRRTPTRISQSHSLRTDPTRIFQSQYFSQITGKEVSFNFLSKIRRKTRLIGNIADQVQVQVQVFGIANT